MKESTQEETITFSSFGLDSLILKTLEEEQFKVPSSIQEQAIPQVLAGRDIIGQAQTGTGKTGAFGLPSLHMLYRNPGKQMLVLTPTRELAKQVSDELFRFGRHLGIKTVVVCGGKSSRAQLESLERGAQICVATPGRLLDLLSSGGLPNFNPSIIVLDEADEMLDMGFVDDIISIFKFLPAKRQTLMFSATMPFQIQKLAEKILSNSVFIRAKQTEKVNQDIAQFYYMIREDERDHALIRIIDHENPAKGIVFCRTKKDVDRLTQTLLDSGYSARGLHGDMEQPQREEVMKSFRTNHLRFLIATDVAARGLSVSDVSHVFNYHLPFDQNSYVHRIGRTGRAGNKGTANTLLTTREWGEIRRLEKALGTKIEKRDIPNLSQVKVSKRHELIKRILSQSIHEETEQVMKLMQDVDEATLASKLISMVIGQQMILGPDQIGVKDNNYQNSDTSSVRKRGSSNFRKGPKPAKFFHKKKVG